MLIGKFWPFAAHRSRRRGSVAIWIAVMIPGMLMAAGMAIEIGGWGATQLKIQRVTDSAAASAITHLNNGFATPSANYQAAANYAAAMAVMNGASATGAAPRAACSGSACYTSSSGAVMASLNAATSPVTLTVAADAALPAQITYPLLSSRTTFLVHATSSAQWLSTTTAKGGGGASTGYAGQPCLMALGGAASPVPGIISGAGSTNLNMPNCTVVSRGTINLGNGGGPTLSTGGYYATGSITFPSWYTVSPSSTPVQPNQTDISADPFASNTALSTAFTDAAAITPVAVRATTVSNGSTNSILCGSLNATGAAATQNAGSNNCNGNNTLPNGGICVTNGSVTCTLYPGHYGSFSTLPGGGPYVFNLQPGLYLFNGDITLAQSTKTTGTGGVSFVTTGQFTGEGTFVFQVSAPTAAQVTSNGGVAGIALASQYTSTTTASGYVACRSAVSGVANAIQICGNASFWVQGAVYAPNGVFDASGANGWPAIAPGSTTSPYYDTTTSNSTCLELVAWSIYFSGSSSVYTNSKGCSSLGVGNYYSKTMTGSQTVTQNQARLVN